MDYLKELISRIHELHLSLTEQWREYARDNGIILFNQKTTKVKHFCTRRELMESVNGYVTFLKERSELESFNGRFDGYEVTSRIKNLNSIEEKIEDYSNYRKEKGEIGINKCLNDLFGIRITIDCEKLVDDEIVSTIQQYGNAIFFEDKNVPARGNAPPYKAKHLYFKCTNEDYRWELQIWRAGDQESNHESHKTHRYMYRGWESDGKKIV